MFAHYSELQTATGTIKLIVEAKAPTGSASQTINTEIQYERPSKFFLRQIQSGKEQNPWVVSSDGSLFSYPMPSQIIYNKSKRLVENVGVNTIAEIYGASVTSIGDRSAPLGIIVSWNKELRRIVSEWPVYELAGEQEWKGAKVWKIVGKYRQDPLGPVIGDFVLVVDKSGNMLEYKTTQAFATPTDEAHSDAKHPSYDTKNLTYVTYTWMVDVAANGTVDSSLFKLVTEK